METEKQYFDRIDSESERDEAISDLSVEISLRLKKGQTYQPGNVLDTNKPYWHMDDFISDVEIDTAWMTSMLNGDSESMQADMKEKFEKFCGDAAEKSIDKVWELAQCE